MILSSEKLLITIFAAQQLEPFVLLRQISPVLSLHFSSGQATDGHHYEKKEGHEAMLEGFRHGCEHFRYHDIQGKHHIHLTEVDAVAAPIMHFIDTIKKLGYYLG